MEHSALAMKEISVYVMALVYVVAGINHFVHPRFYLKIMPPLLPYPAALVNISGVCEILFALLLLPVATRHVGAELIIFLLVAVFPANIYMAINWRRKHYRRLWIAYLRLPLQLVLIWWAYSLM